MMLLIKNDLGQDFSLEVDDFEGYEVFVKVREQWKNWSSYTVFYNDVILERVLNPENLI
ncbi:MAG: hypothetical protein ACO295_08570 [Sediminibacterium sp.]